MFLNPSGLKDIIAVNSNLSFIDGDLGKLLYRGIDVKDLVHKSTFEESIYLLWYGRLPKKDELETFTLELCKERTIHNKILDDIKNIPYEASTISILKSIIPTLPLFEPVNDDPIKQGVKLVSKIPTIVAAIYRIKNKKEIIQPHKDLSYAENFVYMLKGKYDDIEAKAIETDFILHLDHELNASTFAARTTASTLSDLNSAISTGVNTLKGPLHGGASEDVIKMIMDIECEEKTEEYITKKLHERQKIPGFGHRVYKTIDPRAAILKSIAIELCEITNNKQIFNIQEKIEAIMKRQKRIYPNVDYYSATVYYSMKIDIELYIPIFVIGRMAGWVGHVLEQYDNNKLIRPRAKYTGFKERKYTPMNQR